MKLAIAKLPFAPKLALADVKPGIVPMGVDLHEAMKLSPAAKNERWSQTLESLNSMKMPSNPDRKGAATYDEALVLHQALAKNPIVVDMAKYQPNGGCFLKSMIGHLELLSAGYAKESSLSLFQIWDHQFPKEGEKPSISFHAARAVRASDGGWWVLDPLLKPEGPVKLESWGSASTFVGEGNRLLPEGQGAFKFNPSHFWNWTTPTSGVIDFESPRYNGFMPALKDYFRAKAGGRAWADATEARPVSEADMATLARGQANRAVFETREPFQFPRLPNSRLTSATVDEALAALLITPRGLAGTEAVRLARRVEETETQPVAARLLPHLIDIAMISEVATRVAGVSLMGAARGLSNALEESPPARNESELRALVSSINR